MNAPPPLFMLPEPVTPDLRHAFGGVWRLTLRRHLAPGRWVMLLAGLAALGLLAFAASHDRRADHYAGWVVDFYVAFLVPAFAFVTAAGAMRDDMKTGTVDYVLTRPMPRPAYVVARFVAHTVLQQLDFLLALAMIVVIGSLRGFPGLMALTPGFLVAQALLITAFAALGFLAAVLTSRYLVIGIVYAGVIEAGLGQIPTQISRLSLTRQAHNLFAPTGEIVSATAVLGTGVMMFLFATLALAAAAALFRRREFGGA
ncbi:MAG: ABC transporter permease [Opitutaceae bacterium]|nr:ABC transporter permease [Opitutaceae bacterium]